MSVRASQTPPRESTVEFELNEVQIDIVVNNEEVSNDEKRMESADQESM